MAPPDQTPPPFTRLGIVAGSGDLPRAIAERARSLGIDVHVFVLRDQGDVKDFEADFPTSTIRMGAARKAFETVRAQQISDLIFAGAVRRPSLLELRPDAVALKVVGRGLLKMGDDGLLRAVIDYLQDHEGFRIHPINTILSDIRPTKGPLGAVQPDAAALADIEKGRAVLSALSDQDVGQGVVIQEMMVLGIEALEGTDALIRRCGDLKRDGRGPVLVKLSKRGQSEDADLPTIGPDTVAAAHTAGFSGIAVEAEGSLIVMREKTVALANDRGLFLIAVDGVSEK